MSEQNPTDPLVGCPSSATLHDGNKRQDLPRFRLSKGDNTLRPDCILLCWSVNRVHVKYSGIESDLH